MLHSLIGKVLRNNIFKYLYYRIFKPRLNYSVESIEGYYSSYKTEQPFIRYKTSEFDRTINEEFNSWSESGELEYLIHYPRECMIEPYIGWGLDSKNNIIKKSLPYGEAETTVIPHYIYYKRKKYIDLECAVSIRYNWFNYWHFYNDVIGQMYFLSKNNFDKSIPIVIPQKALDLAYVRDFLNTGFSKKWKWIYQDRETYIRLRSAYFCKSIPNIKDQFIFANNVFSIEHNTKELQRRVFLKRDSKRGRYISNLDELEPILRNYGFDIVDAEEMTLTEQISLFSSAEVIVGPHGAGLTNILYRYPNECTLIEIFPSNFIPAHYYWLAKELEIGYEPILGSKLTNNGFRVSRDTLHKTLRKVVGEV